MTVNLNLSVEETNAVLNALGSFPFNQVAELIANIKSQAEAQVSGEIQND